MDVTPNPEVKKKEGSTNPDSASNYWYKRRLVVCLDGTWNQRDSGTNIYHISNLVLEGMIDPTITPAEVKQIKDPAVRRRKEECTKAWVQMVYYDEGVGTGLLDSATGGAFGIGLSENVRQAYDWLVERYRDGDHVYVFGFSRGAFTARSLVGMIAKCGLLYRGAPLPPAELWKGYQKMAPYPPPKDREGNIAPRKKWWQPFGPHRQGPFRPRKYLKASPGEPKFDPPGDMNETEKLLCLWSRRIPIKCLAVYDTVGTFGIEALAIPWLRERRAQFHDTQLTTLIQHGFHGLAIDEHRGNFNNIPWHRATELDTPEQEEITQTYGPIQQRWFIGGHSDIGGSNENDVLAQLPLRWFVKECEELNLVFKPSWPDEPDVRTATRLADCVPLRLVASKDGKPPKPGHVSDSYTEFAKGLWRHLIRAKRNYRKIQPPAEFQNGKEVRSLNETLHPSVLELLELNEQETGSSDNYNPPNLYEYRKRQRDRVAQGNDGKNPPAQPDNLPLVEPPFKYLEGRAAKVWFAVWLFCIGMTGALISRVAGGCDCRWIAGQWYCHLSRWYCLTLILPLIAGLADWAESSVNHKQALDPSGPTAERRGGLLDLLLNLRLVAIGAFVVGAGYFVWTLLDFCWFAVPAGEAAWLLAFCAMMIHFNASRVWAAQPMIDAGFGSILKLQEADTPAAVSGLLRDWMERGPGGPDPHRLVPVQRTIWRDLIGFIPAYTIAFFAGLWMTLSLIYHFVRPDEVSHTFLALLSTSLWCWPAAALIAGFGAIADGREDRIHLQYLQEPGKEPSQTQVARGRRATKMKVAACLTGLGGFLVAILSLGLLQFYRLLVHLFPCVPSEPVMRHLPPPVVTIPAVFSLALAATAMLLAYSTVRAFLAPPVDTA
jgi:uncharacterized protein (DUF2235 family)